MRRLHLLAGPADDIAAEAVLRVLERGLARVPDVQQLAGAWIAGVVRHVAAEELRRLRTRPVPLSDADLTPRQRPATKAGLVQRLRRLAGDEPWIPVADRPLLAALAGGAPERTVAHRHGISRSALRRRMEALLRRAGIASSLRLPTELDCIPVEALGEEDRRIVELRRAGATYAAIARELGATTSAVRLRLRKILREFGGPPPGPRS